MLKLTYDSLEEIPETINPRTLYVERDGKFTLNGVDGIKTQADIDRLQRALDSERTQGRQAKAKFEPWESVLGDLTPEDFAAQRDELEELRTKLSGEGDEDARLEKLVEARVARERGPLERKIERLERENRTVKEENTGIKQGQRKAHIEAKLRDAASKASLSATAVDDLLRYADAFDVTEAGQIVTRDGSGYAAGIDADTWLGDRKQDRPHWWPPAQGAGATGSNRSSVREGQLTPEQAGSLSMSEYRKARAEGRIP